MAQCRAHGVVGAVRVNKLESEGRADLAGVLPGRPDLVFLPHVETAAQVEALCAELAALEAANGVAGGSTEIVPTIESAKGLLGLGAILRASARIKACLLAAEDFADSLGATRGPDAVELLHARGRFLLECVAAGRVAIDCPCTFRAAGALEQDLALATRLGFKAKCVVFPEHVGPLNRALTPSPEAVRAATALCAAWEAQCRQPPSDIADWIDSPRVNNARRLLARHQAFEAYRESVQAGE
jgi:citrate lyase subunit beta/citryl-CoA lyase